MLAIKMLLVATLTASAQTPPVKPASPPVVPPVVDTSGAKTPAIPADGERATKALVESPRHGEWVNIPLAAATGETQLKTWVSYPERKDSAPVVIVIHEIFGLTDWVRGVADQLAAEGFIAVAPDLLSGKGPGGGATDSFEGDKVRAAIGALDKDEVVMRLDAVRAYATALPAATKKCAVIGFCWGGTTVWTYATKQPTLDAGIVFYGTAPDDKDTLAKITAPILGCYGEDDQRVTSTVEKTKTLTKEVGKSFDAKIYDGAGHGFLRQQTGRDGANEKAARASWAETLAFLRARLEGKPG